MKISDQKQRATRRRGFALMTVLALAGLLMVVAGAIGAEVMMTQSATKTRLSDSRARFAAYTGLQYAVRLLRTDQALPTQNALLVLMPGSQSVSFTLQIVDNRGEDGAIVAPDGTSVPGGAVYCASVGLDNGKAGVALHAMSGMLSNQHPQLTYAAFADQSTELLGQSESVSYNPANEFQVDANGNPTDRPTPLVIGTQGDIGTNRAINLDPTAGISGNIHRPASEAPVTLNMEAVLDQMVADDGVQAPELLDLVNPVDIPRFSAPSSVPLTGVGPSLQNGSVAATPNETAKIETINVPQGETLVLAPGRYFVSGDMEINGSLQSSGDQDNPVIIYVGGDTTLGQSAKVNLGGDTAGLQLFFVDTGKESQHFTMTGQSDFFGTVVGNRVEGVFQNESQMFGGFLGRSVSASGNAKLFYDESLADKELNVAANWGLNGVTEPKPEVIMKAYTATSAKVASVVSGTPTYTSYTATMSPIGGQHG
jgi:hypothetical protein